MTRPRLSTLDASFLRIESASAHMHVAWKGVFAPRPDRGPIAIEELRASVAARLRFAPRFRQRLAYPPAGLAEPVWVDDERFDIAAHVVALSAPHEEVTRKRFDALTDRVLSEPLDRTRALWRISLVPHLAGGGSGLVMRAHHAMVDGKSAVELALLLLDLAPDAQPPAEPDDWAAAPAPGGTRLALEAIADRGGESLRFAGGLARAAANPRGSARIAGTLRRAALSMSEDVLRPAPASYVNVPIGPKRTLVGHASSLAPLLEMKSLVGGGVTLNDVALAVVAGGLRQFALHQQTIPQSLKIMVPVSLRAPEEAADLGNRISFVFIDLPVQLRNPVERLAAIHAATSAFKRDRRAEGGDTVMGALAYLPSALKGPAARLAASPRTYNLTVSNVPGPRVPGYLLGAELREAWPVIPLSDGHALSIGIFTYRDRVFFSGYADPTALPDADQLPAALSAASLELATAARRLARDKPAVVVA